MAKAKKKLLIETQLRHPRETLSLAGQAAAEQSLLQAYNSQRMPHAWLITGPKGIGKATLAHRFARFLLTAGRTHADSLQVDTDFAPVRRILNQSHGDLMTLEGAGGDISVEEARQIPDFLSYTPSESKRRVVIVDAIDDMNRNAANAILKTLEEPSDNAVLLLVSHNPGGLLPTIRSRCRLLKLKPLSRESFASLLTEHAPNMQPDEQAAYYQLSEGSPGVALFLKDQEALALYHALLECFPLGNQQADWLKLHALADQMQGVQNTLRFEVMQHVLQYLFRQLIRVSQLGAIPADEELLEGETDVLQHIAYAKSTDYWLSLWEETSTILTDTRRIHLDRKQVMINIISAMQPRHQAA